LELLQRRRELGFEPVLLSKESRPLKPRSPRDCPVCRHPHPKPLWGHAHKPGVEPWPQRKSPRGRHKKICTAGRACPNLECDCWGNTDPTIEVPGMWQALFEPLGDGALSAPGYRLGRWPGIVGRQSGPIHGGCPTALWPFGYHLAALALARRQPCRKSTHALLPQLADRTPSVR
jgi:hypothetical protein